MASASDSIHSFQLPFILAVQAEEKTDVNGLGCLGTVHVQRWSSKIGAKSAVAVAHSLISASAVGASLAAGFPREAVGYNIAVYPTLPQGPQHTDGHPTIQILTIQKTNLLLPQ